MPFRGMQRPSCWVQHPTMRPLRQASKLLPTPRFEVLTIENLSIHSLPARSYNCALSLTSPRAALSKQAPHFFSTSTSRKSCRRDLSQALGSPRRYGRPLHHQGARQGYAVFRLVAPIHSITNWYTPSDYRRHPSNRPERCEPLSNRSLSSLSHKRPPCSDMVPPPFVSGKSWSSTRPPRRSSTAPSTKMTFSTTTSPVCALLRLRGASEANCAQISSASRSGGR